MLLATGEDFLSSQVCNSYVHQCYIYLMINVKIIFFYDGKAEFSTPIITHHKK